jgi:hypothetical protein
MTACTPKPDHKDLAEIKSGLWTWVSGERSCFGDFIEFGDGDSELRGDSIYERSVFKGRITGYHSKHREITIKTPDGKRLVYYNHDFK